MPPPTRRARPAASKNFVAFMAPEFYSGGFLPPEGNYALTFHCDMHAHTKQDGSKGQERLMMCITFYPLGGGEPVEHWVSMGSKAHASFQPDPDSNGKRIVAIPGAPATSMPRDTDWQLLLDSIHNATTMPDPSEVDMASIEWLDGIWVHTRNIPEPERRKSYGSRTGLQEDEQQQGPHNIVVVTEVLEDGKPWEDGGGIPEGAGEAEEQEEAEEAPTPKAKTTAKPAAKPAAKPTTKTKAAPAEEDGDVLTIAAEAITSVLEDNPEGTSLLKLRSGAGKVIREQHGGDMLAQVVAQVFEDADQLATVLGELGFSVDGRNVVPA